MRCARVANALCALHPLLMEARWRDALRRNIPRQARAWRVPGFQGALGIDDRPAAVFTFGLAGGDVPLTSRTRFRVGSLVKPVTALAALCMADAGEFDLDEPVAPWLPEFAPSLALERITVRLLLSHTAGLAHRVSPEVAIGAAPGLLDGEVAAPETEPGTRRLYTSSGHSLVQIVMERRLGRAFDQIARERVLVPLGMSLSGFDMENAALGVEHDEQGVALARTWTPATASAGLCTTAGDLVKLGRGLLRAARGEGGLLSPRRALDMLTAQPPGFPDGSFTLGLHAKTEAGVRCLSHGGVRPGLRALLLILPGSATVFAAIANGGAGSRIIRPLRGLVTELARQRPGAGEGTIVAHDARAGTRAQRAPA